MLKAHVRKNKRGWGYTGFVVCTDKGRRMWSESTHVNALTRDDAMRDAVALREWITEINRIDEVA